MNRFDDKVVLVTGAAGGIGKASAERIAQEGGKVVCVDIQAEAVELTAKQIREAGGEAIAIACDVSDPASVSSSVDGAIAEYGKLDSLCNIAGIVHFDNTHELTLEKWNKVLAVNLTGAFLMSQTALPHLLASRGNIVNMSSTAGIAGHPWTAAYSASKGGLLALTYTFAVEYGKQGLRANAVCPGSVKTAMHDQFRLPEGADAKLLQRIMPLDTFRGPETAAALVAFLASEDAAHINGESVRVDGGTLA
ncbi:MAG: SDR family oxidoreductase [Deltaproteobacteria bacterium]|nr:SDR family oxidoreductase [Deltaproteobacteria bacterium]MBW2384895.1 SDR family oxidoreductase [Deltaproteobacteria bacterium]MBW2697413.1 SDR family oxidoreductase [Deltaproteobacteria bacterium]